jgi:hypothetical protein
MLVVASFIGVAVFGIVVMNMDGSGHGGCIGATAQGKVCPEKEGPLAYINFHGSAFKKFSTAVFGQELLGGIFLAFLMAFIFGVLRDILSSARSYVFKFDKLEFANILNIPLRRNFRHYLSLHENSPNFA